MSQYEALAKEFESQAGFFTVSAGENRSLLQKMKVKGVPTFLFFKNGVPIDTVAGEDLTRDELWAKMEAIIR